MNKDIEVLIVDDEADFREIMKVWLESKGYVVKMAPDGKTAVQMVKEKAPDILFLDLNMPELDGTETLREIRKFNKTLPVIVLSAYLEQLKIDKTKILGIEGIFYKSENFEQGFPHIESVLRTHKNLKK